MVDASEISKMVDENLPEAITYRRRDYENESMMNELCRRNCLKLPSRTAGLAAIAPPKAALALLAARVLILTGQVPVDI